MIIVKNLNHIFSLNTICGERPIRREEDKGNSFKKDTPKVQALQNINLVISKGEMTMIAGPSGSGKTTLLNILGLILKPSSAEELTLDGKNLLNLKERQLAEIRRNEMGFIFQSFNLIPVLTVYENVEYFALKKFSSHLKFSTDTANNNIQERVRWSLEKVGIQDQAYKYPWQLSGGQRQRVAIARAVVKNPHWLFADEPTANLDQKTGEGIINLLAELNHTLSTTVLIATHDPKMLSVAKRVLQIVDGRILL